MAETGKELDYHRKYYRRTASLYDTMNVHERDEHSFAVATLLGQLDFFQIRNVLEIGAGTGRILLQLKSARPGLRVCGIEPVAELRQVGRNKGLKESELVDGDGYALPFESGTFDLVCCFGVLHHVAEPGKVIGEMLRVAGKAVFVSDSNNFGQGCPLARLIKQCIHRAGLWRLATWMQTHGRGYHTNESDGLFYSYSVCDNYEQVRLACAQTYWLGTQNSGPNLYRTAGHVALLGVK